MDISCLTSTVSQGSSPHPRAIWGMCLKSPPPRALLSVSYRIWSEAQFTTGAMGSPGGEIFPQSSQLPCLLGLWAPAACPPLCPEGRACECLRRPLLWGRSQPCPPALVCSFIRIRSTVLGRAGAAPASAWLRHLVGFLVYALCPEGHSRRQDTVQRPSPPRGSRKCGPVRPPGRGRGRAGPRVPCDWEPVLPALCSAQPRVRSCMSPPP